MAYQSLYSSLDQILEAIDFYRGIVLDAVEQEVGDSPNWRYLRSRLLKALGDRGLSKRVSEIVANNHQGFSNASHR